MNSTAYSPPAGLQALPPGSHLCCLYESAVERSAVLRAFLQAGLRRGETAALLTRAGEEGLLPGPEDPWFPAFQQAREQGRLVLLHEDDLPGRIASLVSAAGRAGLRIARDCRAAGGAAQDGARPAPEDQISARLRATGATLLSLYNRRQRADLLLRALAGHTHALVGGELYPGPEAQAQGRSLADLLLEGWPGRLQPEAAGETGRLRAELEQCREREARYRFVVDQHMDLVARCLPGGAILFVNLALSRLIGISPEALAGRSFLEFVAESDRPGMETLVRELHSRITPDDPLLITEFQVVDAQGAHRWLRCKNQGIFDEQGTLVEVLSSGRDISWQKQAALDFQLAQVEMEQRVLDRTLELAEANRQLEQEVAERKRVEEALRESEERFSKFMRYLPGLAFIKDRERRSLYVNERFEDFFGIRQEDWLGKTGDEYWRPNEAAGFREDDEFIFDKCQPVSRIEIVKQGDELRTYLTNKFPIFQPGKDPLLGGISIDITERYQAEQALRQSEARFRWLVSSLDDIVFTLDLQGRLTSVYGRLNDRFDLVPERVIGKNVSEIFDESIARQHKGEVARALSGESLIYECEFGSAPDKIYFQVSLAPLRASEGQLVGVAGLGRDITAKKRAELALKESEERFRLLYERAPLGYQSLDIQGCFIDVNQTWQEMMGYTRAEVCGKPFSSFMTPESAGQFPVRFSQFLERGVVVGNEFEMVRKDGSRFIASFNGKVGRDPNGQFLQTHCIMEDITEQRRAEERLKSSLQEKEVMLREIHHRVKNNLQIMASLLRLQSESLDDPAALAAFEQSRQRIRSMALVHEELYHSQNLAQVDLASYLQKLGAYLHSAYGSGPAVEILVEAEQVHVSVEKAIPCGLIVNELVSNAMKYAFEGRARGTITIQLRTRGDELLLRVADNGVGLPAGLEIERSETLGLQLVSILAHQLEGELQLEDAPGAALRLVFPVR